MKRIVIDFDIEIPLTKTIFIKHEGGVTKKEVIEIITYLGKHIERMVDEAEEVGGMDNIEHIMDIRDTGKAPIESYGIDEQYIPGDRIARKVPNPLDIKNKGI